MTRTRDRRDTMARDVWQAMADLVLDNERRRDVDTKIHRSIAGRIDGQYAGKTEGCAQHSQYKHGRSSVHDF